MDVVNVGDLAGGESEGFVWSAVAEDLNVNLLVLAPGGSVPEHRNDGVDVLLVAVSGQGMITVEGQRHRLRSGDAMVIPKGTTRTVASVGSRFGYLTCHRRRGGLQIQPLVRQSRVQP